MLNAIGINKRHRAVLSTLDDAPHTALLVQQLVASHLEALTVMSEVANELWLAEDRGVATIPVGDIIAKLEGKTVISRLEEERIIEVVREMENMVGVEIKYTGAESHY
jgi:hypothetical protein